MPKTDGEKREYQRGYNRAMARSTDRAWHVIEIAKGYRQRLTDTDTERRCVSCDRWTRGAPNTHWGFCRADFEWGLEGRMWVDVEGPCELADKARIVTQPEFGCVSWIPRITNCSGMR